MRRTRLISILGLLVLAGLTAAPVRAKHGPTVTEFPTPTPNSLAEGVEVTRDGSIWYCETLASRLVLQRPDRSVVEYPVPNAGQPNTLKIGSGRHLVHRPVQQRHRRAPPGVRGGRGVQDPLRCHADLDRAGDRRQRVVPGAQRRGAAGFQSHLHRVADRFGEGRRSHRGDQSRSGRAPLVRGEELRRARPRRHQHGAAPRPCHQRDQRIPGADAGRNAGGGPGERRRHRLGHRVLRQRRRPARPGHGSPYRLHGHAPARRRGGAEHPGDPSARRRRPARRGHTRDRAAYAGRAADHAGLDRISDPLRQRQRRRPAHGPRPAGSGSRRTRARSASSIPRRSPSRSIPCRRRATATTTSRSIDHGRIWITEAGFFAPPSKVAVLEP